MDKGDYIEELFDNIKDNIELDSDIIALETLLQALLKINPQKSINKWLYLLKKYQIQDLENDIDFTPILNTFPISIIENIGIEEFFELTSELESKNKDALYRDFLNIYNKKCGLYSVIHHLIINKDVTKEKDYISYIIKKSCEYPKGIFDAKDFLYNIITYHLENNNLDINLLLEIAELPNNIKDKSLLKTLLIDYI